MRLEPRAVSLHTRKQGSARPPHRVFLLQGVGVECTLGSWKSQGIGLHPQSLVPAPLSLPLAPPSAPREPFQKGWLFLVPQSKSCTTVAWGRDRWSARLGSLGRTPRADPCLQLFFYCLAQAVKGAKGGGRPSTSRGECPQQRLGADPGGHQQALSSVSVLLFLSLLPRWEPLRMPLKATMWIRPLQAGGGGGCRGGLGGASALRAVECHACVYLLSQARPLGPPQRSPWAHMPSVSDKREKIATSEPPTFT